MARVKNVKAAVREDDLAAEGPKTRSIVVQGGESTRLAPPLDPFHAAQFKLWSVGRWIYLK